jgi:hypothetical protein
LTVSDQYGDGNRFVNSVRNGRLRRLIFPQEKKKGKKKSKSSSGSANAGATMAAMTGQPAPASATTTGAAPQISTGAPSQRNLAPRVEEIFDDE